MVINLEQEQKSLEAEIKKLELQIAPLHKELQERRERLFHVKALRAAKTGNSIASVSAKVKRGIWSELCRQHGWYIGGDSAHRVVRRQDGKLHSSIPHKCDYDGKTYP